MTMHSGRFKIVAFAAALLLLAATERGAQAQAEWVNAVRQGGYVIVFRHGATHQDQADTDPLNLKNVAQQRQLNDSGRAKAKEIGEAFRKLRITCWAGAEQRIQSRCRDRHVDESGRGDGLARL